MITNKEGYREAYLVAVGGEVQEDGTVPNHNKFYEMKQVSPNEFVVTYGRVEGGTPQTKRYPMHRWNSIYHNKTGKWRNGYIYRDVTKLRAVATASGGSNDDGVSSISDVDVRRFIKALLSYTNRSVSSNYSVVSSQVTQAQVDKAQSLLNTLVSANKDTLNDLLLELYAVIPRQMKQVGDYLLEPAGNLTYNEFNRLIAQEQDALDSMAQQVHSNVQVATPTTSSGSILDRMGVQIRPAVGAEYDLIRKQMQGQGNRVGKAFRVMNERTQVDFDNYLATVTNDYQRMLWHGSRNENWLSILERGLRIRPTGVVLTGAMFGNGVYFADRFQKSLGYTSVRGSYWARGTQDKGVMALFSVHLGNQLRIKHHESWCYNLSESKLKQRGDYDSLYAVGGADLINDEFVVYSPVQSTVAYVVEVN